MLFSFFINYVWRWSRYLCVCNLSICLIARVFHRIYYVLTWHLDCFWTIINDSVNYNFLHLVFITFLAATQSMPPDYYCYSEKGVIFLHKLELASRSKYVTSSCLYFPVYIKRLLANFLDVNAATNIYLIYSLC